MVNNGAVLNGGNQTFFLVHVLVDYRLIISDIIQRNSETMAEDGLTCIESVLCLLNVVCVWVVVYIVGYLVDAWQRMENLHIVLALTQHGAVENLDVFDTLIFHEVGEALFLHARHVYNVGLGDDVFVEVGVFHVFYAVFIAV